MRAVPRPRRYIARHWLLLLSPVLRYSESRHAYVLRLVGRSAGPVLRVERRARRRGSFEGVDRRRPRAA